MPLTTCVDCGKEISSEAFACPNCGRPTGKQQRLAKKKIVSTLVLWLVLVVAFLGIWLLLGSK